MVVASRTQIIHRSASKNKQIDGLFQKPVVGDPFERPISNRPNGSTADMSPYSIDQVSIHLLRKSGPYDQYPYS
jgi:hypothetical protein